MSNVTRRYDIDWLRTLGVLLVIPFHSLLMFNMDPRSIVYVKGTVNVGFFNIISSIIHCFHMPLLFMLAGMSACLSIQSRRVSLYVSERVNKLLIPALFGCIAFNPVMTYIYFVSKDIDVSLAEHYIGFFTKNPGDFAGLGGGFTPGHLWFILFLFVFSLVGLPIILYVSKHRSSSYMLKLVGILEKPLMLALTIIPVTILSAFEILGDKNPLVYFSMFLLGFFIITYDNFQKAINRDKWIYLLLTIVLMYIKFTIPNTSEPWSLLWIVRGILDMAMRLFPVFAMLGVANSFIHKSSRLLKYLSKASFTVYVIHMLINTLAGFIILQLNIGVGLKYILIVMVTFIFSFLFYEVIKPVKVL